MGLIKNLRLKVAKLTKQISTIVTEKLVLDKNTHDLEDFAITLKKKADEPPPPPPKNDDSGNGGHDITDIVINNNISYKRKALDSLSDQEKELISLLGSDFDCRDKCSDEYYLWLLLVRLREVADKNDIIMEDIQFVAEFGKNGIKNILNKLQSDDFSKLCLEKRNGEMVAIGNVMRKIEDWGARSKGPSRSAPLSRPIPQKTLNNPRGRGRG